MKSLKTYMKYLEIVIKNKSLKRTKNSRKNKISRTDLSLYFFNIREQCYLFLMNENLNLSKYFNINFHCSYDLLQTLLIYDSKYIPNFKIYR
jgi:hypothetical protein